MAGKTYEFAYPAANSPSIIKVIGVGGGGSNAVNHMYRQGIRGVEFYVCNTDMQALDTSPVPNKIQIGTKLTQGLGSGAKPEVGREAAMESKEQIRELLSRNTKMVFITAGMGKGTGTGAAPVIAEVAKELGILTVGIVTMPFEFEGRPKSSRAEEGINELRRNCDTVLVILNNRLKEVYGSATMREAFSQADNVLLKAAKSIAEIITVSGNINVDFEDVRTVMKDAGAAVMGSATIEGENRARRAAEGAITSPLLNNTNIQGARYILLSIVVGDEDTFQMEELQEITDYVQKQAGEDTEVIFGQAVDATLGNAISVTIIATGFEDKTRFNPKKVIDLESNKTIQRPAAKVSFEIEDSGDFFEKSTKEHHTPSYESPKSQPRKPEKVVFQLDGEVEQREENEFDKKKSILDQQFQQRKARLDSLRSVQDMSNEELKEKKDVPAYLRKQVKLDPLNPSGEYVTRKKDDILGDNRFLHDNVD